MAVSIIQNYGNNNDPSNAPFSGPLAALYNNRYAYDSLQYPRDLGSSYKGHIVKFDIYEVNPVTLSEVGKYAVDKLKSMGFLDTQSSINMAASGIQNAWNNATTGIINAATNAPGAAAGAVSSTINSVQNFSAEQLYQAGVNYVDNLGNSVGQVFNNLAAGNYTSYDLKVEPRNERVSKSISLYMPDTVEFNYATPYTELTLAEAAGSVPLVGGIAKAITSTAGPSGNALVRLGLNAAGYVFNPQQQLMFQGIDFRTYQMSFVFTPTSAQEAQNIKNIIQTFRKYAAPVTVKGAAGFFFNPPGMFDVSFLYNNSTNTNLNKIKKSVIENISVNYAPNGWAAHEDGAPVQTTLTISFKEMVLVDREAITQGY